MFLVSRFWLGLIEGLGKKLHKYVGYFKFVVLKFGTSCMILMLFACFFYSNMFGYGSVTF
jgi:hypothetical protein